MKKIPLHPFAETDSRKILQSLVDNGMLEPTEIEQVLYMSKKTDVNKVHTQKIGVRSDGRFYTYIYLKDERKQKCFNSEKQMYDFLYDFYFGISKASLEQLFPDFMLYRRNRGKVSGKTIAENNFCWKRFLQDTDISRKPVCELTVKEYIDFFENLTKDGTYTAKCIGNLKSLLNKMYDYAIRENIIEYNPIKNIDFKEFHYYVPFNDDKVYKNADRIKLLKYLRNVQEPYALAIRLMFQLTVRIGELKSFKWEDVDLENRTIRISKQALTNRHLNDDLSFSERETVVVDYTKKNTPQGKRKLKLTNEALQILSQAKELNPNGEYIFMPKGKLMLTDTFNEHLKKYCNACDIPYYSSHALRFTTCSTMYNGANLMQVSRAMGHSQVATTLHYLRNVETDDELLEQMEKAFAIE